jgi:hypothetical protein
MGQNVEVDLIDVWAFFPHQFVFLGRLKEPELRPLSNGEH